VSRQSRGVDSSLTARAAVGVLRVNRVVYPFALNAVGLRDAKENQERVATWGARFRSCWNTGLLECEPQHRQLEFELRIVWCTAWQEKDDAVRRHRGVCD